MGRPLRFRERPRQCPRTGRSEGCFRVRRLAEQFMPINLALALALLLTAAGGFLWRTCQLTSPPPAARPPAGPGSLVLDYAGILTPARAALDRKLASLQNGHAIEAVIVTLRRPPDEAGAGELVKKLLADWQIGRSQGGRGILMLVSEGDRKIRLAATPELTDVYTDRFFRQIRNWPWQRFFSEGEVAAGVVRAVSEIEKRAMARAGALMPAVNQARDRN